MGGFAAGVTVFKRTEKLRNLLGSIPSEHIETVYVADNGEIDESRQAVYDEAYPFELTVLDLEYDSGLGYGRKKIVEAVDEEYLLIVDNDMIVPENVDLLRDQLAAKPTYGGISGVLLEHGEYRSGCWDIFEGGLFKDDVVILDIRERKQIERVAGAPLTTFEFITNAAVFRTPCLRDYCWDPGLVVEEHLDFYLGHLNQTDWTFGVCPAVVFEHDHGGDSEYLSIRNQDERVLKYRRKSLEKWGYRKRLYLKQQGWIDTNHPRGRYQSTKDCVKQLLPKTGRVLLDDVQHGRRS